MRRRKILLKPFACILFVIIMMSPSLNVFADTLNEVNSTVLTEVYLLENGDQIRFITTKEKPHANARATTDNLKMSQSAEYISGGKILCSFTVIGYFQVTYGISVKCTRSDYTIWDSGGTWSVEDMNTTYNNDNSSLSIATGKANYVKRLLGVKVSVQPVQISVTCDKNGR